MYKQINSFKHFYRKLFIFLLLTNYSKKMGKHSQARRLIGNIDHSSRNGHIDLAVTLREEVAKMGERRARALADLRNYGDVTKNYSWSSTVKVRCKTPDAKRLIHERFDLGDKDYIDSIFVDSHNVVPCYRPY